MAINTPPAPDARLNMKIRSLFLDHLAQTANVAASARAAGVLSSAVHAERRRSPAFRDAWALALSAVPAVTDNDIGKSWIINGTPAGAWANKAGQIAYWIGGSWRFIAPHEAMRVWNKSTRRHSLFISGQWTTAPSISNPTGGTAVDSEARAALVAILQYFRLLGILAT